MARPGGTAIYRYQPAQGRPGPRGEATTMGRVAREMRPIMIREMEQSKAEIIDIFETFAPYDLDERDDFHMSDHIEVELGTVGRVRSTVSILARDPSSGFDYLNITRFGHRGTIKPKRKRWLRWEAPPGTVHFAKETKGHHPETDWVEEASVVAESEADDLSDRIGRVIYTRILRS